MILFFNQNGIITSLITNNSHKNAFYLIRKFGFHFDEIISRDDLVWKPSPEPIKKILNKRNLEASQAIYFGDSFYDLIAAKNAGIKNIFIRGSKDKFQLPDEYREDKKLFEQVIFFQSYKKIFRKILKMSARRQ